MGRRLCVLSVVLVAALSPTAAWAEKTGSEGTTTVVGPVQSGPTISNGSAGFDQTGTQAGIDSRTDVSAAGGTAPAPGAGGDVTLVPIPGNIIVPSGPGTISRAGVIILPPALPANACPPGQNGFFIQDANGVTTGILCVQPGAPATPAPSPLALAQEASAMQPWPVLTMGANPGLGLTGLPSWFWLTGSPLMPDVSVSSGGLTVTVRATLSDAIWTFGDGGGLSAGTDLGRAFPAPSTIQHTYQTDTFGRASYPVSALLRYTVTFSVNGGPFSLLGAKALPYSASYQVNQLQPQAVSS